MGSIPIIGSGYTLATGIDLWGDPDLERVTTRLILDGYPSGQRGLTVNQLAQAFGGSNPPPSITGSDCRLRQPCASSGSAALIAQSVERILGKNEVMGSNPIEGFLPRNLIK